MTLIACGKNDIVVQVAAVKPISVYKSMSNIISVNLYFGFKKNGFKALL